MIGAGSWGTALSIALAQAGWRVNLWARRAEVAEAISRRRRNPEYLSEFELPDSVAPTADLGEAVAGAGMVVLAVPSQGMREVCEQLALHIRVEQGVVSAAKGLEHGTGRRLSQVIGECLGSAGAGDIAVLSGPNLAAEVAAGIATASVVACANTHFAAEVQAAFSAPRFRVYTNPDVVGVELGGALKNIVAIGAGVSDGLGFGDNTKAALVTRGLAEITRLGAALGARAETFRGLSGMGDLVATCAGRKSRNHRVGYELAQGRRLAEILASMAQVAEGVETTRAALRLAASVGVEIPIARAIHQVLFEGMSPVDAVRSLMTRSRRDELEE
ncbi:MAG: NAD(P)-dependent glycerol-3-phosphate dehydrogenase [Armatimonadota bacterium]|nr:MAG: NAD(P)-dependent glycerol-3-phosphate dehydrogenase [Armatimonadota bacterium]